EVHVLAEIAAEKRSTSAREQDGAAYLSITAVRQQGQTRALIDTVHGRERPQERIAALEGGAISRSSYRQGTENAGRLHPQDPAPGLRAREQPDACSRRGAQTRTEDHLGD